ncbi:hypothetical protein LHFGNBLO_003283 [Mesorhizobium sp. AR10]|uniref:hypothetical protein n=1 Tax=Mesorhizobium sp. AR10 TaxID=2865839 RepID=UPI00215EEB84|nr:hypothetical protein [Mesorhizobium sp. AR10]UVK36370.1 hypothetical protein LHFGNBLO_003283 [Mesorhizobium sp. AR10]
MSSFGKKGQDTQRSTNAARPLAGSPVRPAKQPSPHVIYREGETERPSFHGSFAELHWPKFVATAFALFALGYYLTRGKGDLFTVVLATLLAGAFSYLVLNGFRKSVNNVHTARTELFRSPRFAIGAVLGLGYFVYSTFLRGPPDASDSEIARAVAEFTDPLAPFRDGFQQRDLSAVAMLILKAAGMMVLGGLVVKTVAKRLLGEEAGSANNAG